MSFLSLIVKNPFRNKSRALLAIIGIGIGLATIVALGGITNGLIASAEDTLHSGGTDITIVGSESASAQATSFGTATVSEDWIDKVNNVSGVDQSVGVYSTMLTSQDIPMLSIVGIDRDDVSFADLTITDGELFDKNSSEVVVGKVMAENEDINVGDSVTIGQEDYDVVGIFESGNSNQDMSLFMDLGKTQELVQDEGNITAIFVKVNPDYDVDAVADDITNQYGDNLTTVTSLSDMAMVGDMIDMLNGASWGISLLAIIIGAVGIINTMLMSVLERTRELGVLKAVGWSGKRILGMIIGESIVITLFAGVVGSIVGVIVVELFTSLNLLGGMTPVYTIDIFVQAFAIAIVVGILGGLYPAIKAIKLPPTEALRYE